jgi:serine/threonine protein kinase
MASGNEALAPGTALGRYVIERLLGEGGMGAVYLGRHVDLGKSVAIKTLHVQYSLNNEVRARFVREGQSASRIRHPNVVDVYDVAVADHIPYLVMELLDGEDLAHLLKREGPLHPTRVVDIMLPAIAAVAAANDLGIVHRDLKPENVFLAVERNTLKPKVVDFGISKVIDQENNNALTGTSALLGTPYYMSPEQATGAKYLDHRTDQYSLGVIVYECLTARKPIEDATLYSLMHKIVTGDFPPPRQLQPSIPEELERIVLRAMSRDPAQRFASTRELGRALLPFASDRQRSLYAEELTGDATAAASLPGSGAFSQAPSGPVAAPPSTTTLGQSTHQRDVAPPAARRGPWLPLAGGLVVVAAAAWFVMNRASGEAPSASSAAAVSTAPPSPQVVAPAPPSVAVPSAPAVVETPLASSSASPSLAPSAAVSASTTVKPTVRPRPVGATPPNRPGLAPR